MTQYVNQFTLQYSTFVKRGIVESLKAAFVSHPSPTVANAKVALDFDHRRWTAPGIIIKFYERQMYNAGVAHMEWLPSPNPLSSGLIPYQHRLYKGDIEFEIFGMSAPDRDIVRDALIEVLGMWAVSNGGQALVDRLYDSNTTTPFGIWHYVVLNLDLITGYGEHTQIAPWIPEDTLTYQVLYRVPVFGEFYSYAQPDSTEYTLVEEVDFYPFFPPFEPTPDNVSSSAYHKVTVANADNPVPQG